MQIDILHHRISVDGVEEPLTAIEMSLLRLFASRPGRLLTRPEVVEGLWGDTHLVDSNIVDQHVQSLRRKLHDDPHQPRYITTVRGKGYGFALGREQKTD